MKSTDYDIFISYRRDNGADTAKHLRDILTERGYRVFFDTDSLRSGDFNRELLDVIKACTDFIIILSPNSLDRYINEDDWVRQELACALAEDKNVIPVMSGKFTFPEELPEDIDGIRWKNGIVVNIEYFDAMVKKLISFLQSKPKKSVKKLLVPILVLCIIAMAAVFFISNRTSGGESGDIRIGGVTDADSEVDNTLSVPVSYDVDYQYYHDYIPRGTAVLKAANGKEYTAVANSLVLSAGNTMFKGLFSDATSNQYSGYSFTDDVSFTDMSHLERSAGDKYKIEKTDGETVEFVLSDYSFSYDLMYLPEGATDTVSVIDVDLVDSISFDWENTPNINLRYCNVDLNYTAFKCPVAYVWFAENVAPAKYAPDVRLTQNPEKSAGKSVPVSFMESITTETHEDTSENPISTMATDMTITMKNGESAEFECKYFFTTYFMGLNGALIRPENSDIKEVSFSE